MFPGVYLREKRGLLERVGGHDWLRGRRLREVELESTEFNETYELQVAREQDDGRLRELFDPKTIVWLQDHPLRPHIEYRAGFLVVYVPGFIEDMGRVVWLLEAAERIAERVQAGNRGVARRRSVRVARDARPARLSCSCSRLAAPAARAVAAGTRRRTPPDPSITDGSAQRKLDRARERWRQARLHNYRFQLTRQCFCPPTSWVLFVRGDKPVRAPAEAREASRPCGACTAGSRTPSTSASPGSPCATTSAGCRASSAIDGHAARGRRRDRLQGRALLARHARPRRAGSPRRAVGFRAMQTLFALTDAQSYTIAAVAVWFVIFPAFVTALIAFAVAGVLRERTENEEEAARRRRG